MTKPIIGMLDTSFSNKIENIRFDKEKIGKKYSNYSIYYKIIYIVLPFLLLIHNQDNV